jgi:uncharacterized protein YbjQ (UPF0145 family)
LGRGSPDDPEVPLTTTDTFPGVAVDELLAVVGASAADEGRALQALARRGGAVGADAVVGVQVVSTATGGFWVSNRHCFAYGTAVRLSRHAR